MRVSLLPRVTGDLSSFQLEMEPFARGMNGAFHYATERMSGRAVVIKRLARMRDPDTATTLKREYQALYTLAEGPIVPIVGAKFEEGEPFIAYERLRGAISLRAEVRARSFSMVEALELATGITEALVHAHRLGVLHLGLRPSNILITREKEGRSKPHVFDFGLARNVLLENASLWSGLDLERLAYVSPEQSGLASPEVDQRADLYALGALLFELFTGRPPFSAETAAALLHQQIAKRPPSPRSLRPEIGRSLSALLLDLLAKAPAARPPSAKDVLDRLRAISGARASGAPEKSVSAELAAQGPRLVGREREMEELSQAIAGAGQSSGKIVFVGGPAGSGKSSLFAELQASYPEHLAIFAAGSATEFERHIPFSPLPSALGRLVEIIRRGPQNDPSPGAAGRAIFEAIGESAADLSLIAPGLRELLESIPEAAAPDPSKRAQRFLQLVIDLLAATATVFRRPVVLVLDNLQWADPSVHELLWLLSSRIAELPIAVIASHRTTGSPDDAIQQLIGQIEAAVEPDVVKRVTLRPFDREETAELISSYLHGAEVLEPLPSTVHRLTLGNPLHTLQLLKQLLADGSLTLRDGQTQVRSELIERAPLSMSLAAVIERRAAALDRDSARVLSIAAVLGSSFTAVELADAAERDPGPALDAAVALELIERRPGGEIAFVHDRIRGTFVHRLESAEKKRLHERLGRKILDSQKSDEAAIFAIAHHLSQGEHPAEAVPFLIMAAKLAQSRHALAQAAAHWRKVLELEPDLRSPAERVVRHESYADCCTLLGKYDEAERHYRHALALAESDLSKARLEGKVGDIHFRTGNPASISHLERALAYFGEPVPKNRLRLWIAIVLQALLQIFHALRLPRVPALAERFTDVAAVYHKLVYASYFIDRERTLHAHLRQINLAERLPEVVRAGAYSDHALVCGTIPLLDRAIMYATRSLEHRRGANDRWGVGQSHSVLGIMRYYRGEYEDAKRELTRAIEILDGLGDPWEVEAAYMHLYMVQRLTGELEEGADACAKLLRLAQEIRDLKYQSIAWSGLAKISLLQGRTEKALDCAERALAFDPDNLVRAFTYATKAQIHLRRGDLLEAKHAIEQSRAVIKSSRLRNDYVTETLVVAAEIEVETLRVSYQRRRHRSAFSAAEHAVKLALRKSRKFPNYRPAALRLAGSLAAVKGEARRAQRLFEYAAKEATLIGQRYELGRIFDETGRALLEQGKRQEADQSLTRAEKIFGDIGAQHDLQLVLERLGRAVREESNKAESLGERRQIASLYRLSELVSSLRDVERLLDHVMDIAIEATGAERGFLMLYEDERQPKLGIRAARNVERQTIDFDPLEIQREVIESVEQKMEPQISGANRSSVLCVPLKREGRSLGLIYVDNRLIGDLFTRHDLEVLSSFAALVAVTIENAYHYRKIEELNANLEQRIEERTRQLVQSEKMASIGQLAASVAHEIRNPLNGINLAVTLLGRVLGREADANLSDKLAPKLSDITKEVDRANKHISDLLHFSRPQQPLFEPVELIEVLEQALLATEAKQIEVERSFDPSASAIVSDPHLLQQIFGNLALNAVQAMPQGGTLLLSLAPRGDEVEVQVADTGEGIPKEHLNRIFEPFFTTKDPGKGTGLGLSICQAAVKKLGGTIHVESALGSGTRFTVRLKREGRGG